MDGARGDGDESGRHRRGMVQSSGAAESFRIATPAMFPLHDYMNRRLRFRAVPIRFLSASNQGTSACRTPPLMLIVASPFSQLARRRADAQGDSG